MRPWQVDIFVVELDPLGKVREPTVHGQVAQGAPGQHGEPVSCPDDARAQEPKIGVQFGTFLVENLHLNFDKYTHYGV